MGGESVEIRRGAVGEVVKIMREVVGKIRRNKGRVEE